MAVAQHHTILHHQMMRFDSTCKPQCVVWCGVMSLPTHCSPKHTHHYSTAASKVAHSNLLLVLAYVTSMHPRFATNYLLATGAKSHYTHSATCLQWQQRGLPSQCRGCCCCSPVRLVNMSCRECVPLMHRMMDLVDMSLMMT